MLDQEAWEMLVKACNEVHDAEEAARIFKVSNWTVL